MSFEPNTITCGDALTVLHTWPDECVDCVVTSPPYWGLRDYGVSGQLGLEPSFKDYVGHLVEIFLEVKRVLRPRGTLWLNMGDCYAGSWGGASKAPYALTKIQASNRGAMSLGKAPPACSGSGLRPKNLMGMPWRIAFALQDAGWYLRSDIIWHKPNPMPLSVKDRPTTAHEYLFLMAKSERYHYDAKAISEPQSHPNDSTPKDRARAFNKRRSTYPNPRQDKIKVPGGWDTRRGTHGAFHPDGRAPGPEYRNGGAGATRNRRTVWKIAPQPFKGAHFATFPENLVKPCILAGCPAGGIVADPFMGSGTVAKVALMLGRRYAGAELNPKYIEIANNRLGLFAGVK